MSVVQRDIQLPEVSGLRTNFAVAKAQGLEIEIGSLTNTHHLVTWFCMFRIFFALLSGKALFSQQDFCRKRTQRTQKRGTD